MFDDKPHFLPVLLGAWFTGTFADSAAEDFAEGDILWGTLRLVPAVVTAVVLLFAVWQQSRRPGGWARVDTANVAILTGIALVLTAAALWSDAYSAAVLPVAVLLTLCAGFLVWRRRRPAPHTD